ncbi:hypothetical protein ABID21_003143 [Pseudorhizobium tarimense]|uniref:Lipoprotein n=1 Tax=Pseudorhizobium tarimense TaxID=1079109 RepID=A0ABV2H8Z8_9HYPH|nr:hypothetical protein [Pseudorhizobium tarimense]MCJ8520143.1 hypothetical protein [Pseudorhizobium tarimense]
MTRILIAISTVLFLAACSDQGPSTDDPINNTPETRPGTAPTDGDPTPQSGSGGQVPLDAPLGVEKR